MKGLGGIPEPPRSRTRWYRSGDMRQAQPRIASNRRRMSTPCFLPLRGGKSRAVSEWHPGHNPGDDTIRTCGHRLDLPRGDRRRRKRTGPASGRVSRRRHQLGRSGTRSGGCTEPQDISRESVRSPDVSGRAQGNGITSSRGCLEVVGVRHGDRCGDQAIQRRDQNFTASDKEEIDRSGRQSSCGLAGARTKRQRAQGGLLHHGRHGLRPPYAETMARLSGLRATRRSPRMAVTRPAEDWVHLMYARGSASDVPGTKKATLPEEITTVFAAVCVADTHAAVPLVAVLVCFLVMIAPGVAYEPPKVADVVMVNVSLPVQMNVMPEQSRIDRATPAAMGTMLKERPRAAIAMTYPFLTVGRHCHSGFTRAGF